MRILHTMIRVGDLERSIHFYTRALGMQLIRKTDYAAGKFTLAFLGYGPEEENTVIELTHNWGVDRYEIGDGFGHIAIGTDNIEGMCAQIESGGGIITRKPGPMKHGTTVIAFATDPDGYKIELVERD